MMQKAPSGILGGHYCHGEDPGGRAKLENKQKFKFKFLKFFAVLEIERSSFYMGPQLNIV
jgi:hypothetical protein